ncbi:MAG: transporter substrate-binding domain-containing protein [Rhodobacteraceae bacterium]|nr:transporter substrate-binding domain-containing protein [Paracoccaceae bacterium]
MKRSIFACAAVALTMTGGALAAQTLDAVKERGELNCGITEGTLGFSARDANGVHQGFDVEFCRALAVAIFNDADAVNYVELSSANRFTALTAGNADVLYRTTTWTLTRDVDLKTNFVGVNYYDGQAFMVPAELGVSSALELDGATVCIEVGTTTELNLADYFRANGMEYQPLPVGGTTEAKALFEEGACDVYTTDGSALAGVKASFPDPSAYVILPEVASKEPLGPAVRHGDEQWADVVRWVQNALIEAEEYDITSENAAQLAESGSIPAVNRILGVEGGLGEMLGLENDFALNMITKVGNYGEIFARTIGESTPIGLPRGLNALYTEGGIQYAPPFR